MVNSKNDYRLTISKALEQSGILENSFVNIIGKGDDQQFMEKQNDIINSIKKQLPEDMCLSALASWGVGTPNFSAYEKSFCEIVIESTNGNFDRTFRSKFSDLSEKTYRPIALGVPFVFLGAEKMFNKLIQDGYQLLDDDDFYKKWHNASTLQTGISHLIVFLKKIITDKSLKQRLESMAKHNYNNFWINRKLQHRKHNLQVCRECFGESPYDRIYDCLDF
jgi:hypothetical protein